MGTKKIDKTKAKNWKLGDTFAIKIENTNTEYDGRYLILNKVSPPYKTEKNDHIFRAKMTNDSQFPAIQDYNKLEYIITSWIHFLERYLPLSGGETYEECVKRKASLKFYPDEFNYLYTYYIRFLTNPKETFNDFIYIGNQKFKGPVSDYITKETKTPKLVTDKEDYVRDLIKCYEDYNLKKSPIYDEENRKVVEQNVKLDMIPIYIRPKFSEEILKKYAEEEPDEEYYHETYVGREKD